jgi:hypothetical protein
VPRLLSKSRLIDYRQCRKRLWLEIHRKDLREDDPSAKLRMAAGNEVGELARRLYDAQGNGVLLDAQRDGFQRVFEQSMELLPQRRPLFEAGYTADGLFALVDLLLPDGDGRTWRLVEVKSAASVKDYHRDDLAIQVYILERSGVPLSGASVACIDTAWTYPGGGDYSGLLKEQDLLDEARRRAPEVHQWAQDAQLVAALAEAPAIAMGKHCQAPFPCPYSAHCQQQGSTPSDPVAAPVEWLPQVRATRLKARLAEPGVVSMEQVDDRLLNDLQKRVKRSSLQGEPWCNPAAARAALQRVQWPLYMLDFEAVNPAIPRWPGTRPFQQIPFQYSLHVMNRDGTVDHHDFLDLSGADPRRALAEKLVRDIPASNAQEPGGTVLAYNASFEGQVISALATEMPDLTAALQDIKSRLMDLLPVARDAWYHPAQQGSWSIKKVLPTLGDGSPSYADLQDVADGQEAVEAYLRATSRGVDPAEVQHLREALLRYCKQDTEAMVKLWEHLDRLAGTGGSGFEPEAADDGTSPHTLRGTPC